VRQLWLKINNPNARDRDRDEGSLFQGTMVGEIARRYFGPNYQLVDFRAPDFEAMAAQTRQFVDDGAETICEATFILDGDRCLADILRRDGDGWRLIEVKSSGQPKPQHIDDLAFQYYILTGNGLKITRASVMHINKSYVMGETLDPRGLFKLVDCTEAVLALQPDVAVSIAELKSQVRGDAEPDVPIGKHCLEPYVCEFMGHCWGAWAQLYGSKVKTVFDIAYFNKEHLAAAIDAGIFTLEQLVANDYRIPDGAGGYIELDDAKKKDITRKLGLAEEHLDTQGLTDFLAELTYPVYHLDFETYSFLDPIPAFPGLSPFQHVTFQYSVHIQPEPGTLELEHKEFLGQPGTNPMRELAERLVADIPIDVTVLAWNQVFEKDRIKELAALFPDLSDHLMAIHGNIKDLIVPFRKGHYYHPNQLGSNSIKAVLPALFPDDPELNYHNLDLVQNGGDAPVKFLESATMPDVEREAVRAALLKYCGLDTYAMVKILNRLHELSNTVENERTSPDGQI